MARPIDIIVQNKAYAAHSNQPMTNIGLGGQFGWAPNLKEWLGTQAYVRQNLVCLLLESPKFFDYMPNPESWHYCLKAMVETRAKTIDGLKGGLKVDTDEHPVGGAGEMFQEPTNVTRERSTVTMEFVDPYGMPIATFLREWITYGIMDPDTKYAGIGTLANAPDDMLADMYAATMLFFEPDPNHRKVVQSWIVTNMYPTATGDIEGKRDQTSAKQFYTRSIEFTGIAQYGLGCNLLAQTILDKINIQNANPLLRPAMVDKISPDVEAANVGYITGIEDLAQNAIKPNDFGL